MALARCYRHRVPLPGGCVVDRDAPALCRATPEPL